MFYGLVKQQHAVEIATRVCDVLGHGSNHNAVQLLLETAAQETHLGLYPDRSIYSAGFGLCQVDEIGFVDVQKRTRKKDRVALLTNLGVDLNQVEHRELEHSPLLSFVICRLHYKLKPKPIPTDLASRAAYWKKNYNTKSGKGTPGEYVENAHRYLDGLLGAEEYD